MKEDRCLHARFLRKFDIPMHFTAFSALLRSAFLAGILLMPGAQFSAPAFAQTWQERAGVSVVEKRMTNLRGGDLSAASVRGEPFQSCARLCARARLCVAFTVARHPFRAGEHDCFLKSTLTPESSSDCCDSGILTRP